MKFFFVDLVLLLLIYFWIGISYSNFIYFQRALELIIVCNRATKSVRMAIRQARTLGRTIETRFDEVEISYIRFFIFYILRKIETLIFPAK